MTKLIKILEDLKPEIDFNKTDTLIDDGLLDSLDIMQIVAEISDEFDVQLEPSDIIPDNFNSAKALFKLISNKI